MRINSIQSTNSVMPKSTNFKGLWGNVVSSELKGVENMYGCEVFVNRYQNVQEYHPFSDETEEMTRVALNNHAYIEDTNPSYTFVDAAEVTAKMMPKLAISAQEFVDYITGAMGKQYLKEQIETKLKNANLSRYIKL